MKTGTELNKLYKNRKKNPVDWVSECMDIIVLGTDSKSIDEAILKVDASTDYQESIEQVTLMTWKETKDIIVKNGLTFNV